MADVELSSLGAVIRTALAGESDTNILTDDLLSRLSLSASFKDETGTTYTFISGDSAKTITLSNATSITVTLPNNLPVGWIVNILQKGAGQVTFSPASGATLNNRNSHNKIAGQWGMVNLLVVENSGGTSAVYVLNGDTAS